MPALTKGTGNTSRQAAMAARQNGKRRVELVDLTGSDDDGVGHVQRHKVARPNGQTPTLSQSEQDQWLNDLEEADADEIINLSQDGSADENYELYGMLNSNDSASIPAD